MNEVLNTIQQQLKKFGFKDKEIQVYTTLLSCGSTSMTELARAAGLKRPITYVCVDALLQKNLVAKMSRGKRDIYQALPFETILYEQIKKTELARQLAHSIHTINAHDNNAHTVYYSGEKQVTFILEEMLRSKELFGIAYIEEYWNIFGAEHNKHLFELLKRAGGFVYNLVPKTQKTIEYLQKRYRTGLQEIRFLPPHFDTSNQVGLLINDKKVMIHSFDSMTATAIEDKHVVSLHKQMWQTLWDQSEPFTNNI